MAEITLFGEVRCHKTRFYQAALAERGLDYELAEVDKDAEAARRLTELTGSADKFPTFQIKGRKLRNPLLRDLDKELARAGIYDPGLVHDERAQRFIRHMAPSDAYVSYDWQGDRMVMSHIETDPSLRGSGIGTGFATEVFEAVQNRPHEIRLTCPFLRKVAASRPEWRHKFGLGR
ncbi:MAG TPA: N-acetyltransferase [Hyphomonas sp.]|jgi:predicted GNAT family acetyltransferase|nr:N-acetyltransferase [Hyphomonas sp.]